MAWCLGSRPVDDGNTMSPPCPSLRCAWSSTASERDDRGDTVHASRLHPLGGDRPDRGIEVDLVPQCVADLVRAAGGKHQELEREDRAAVGAGVSYTSKRRADLGMRQRTLVVARCASWLRRWSHVGVPFGGYQVSGCTPPLMHEFPFLVEQVAAEVGCPRPNGARTLRRRPAARRSARRVPLAEQDGVGWPGGREAVDNPRALYVRPVRVIA